MLFRSEKITVSGKAGDTSVKVTVTGLKANSYYFGAIRMDGSVLNLFDGSANADGKLEMEVNVGTKLEVDDKLTVAISGANAGTDSVTDSFTVTKTEIKPGNPSGGDDKPTYPTLPEDTYWISTYYNNRGTISVYSRAEAGVESSSPSLHTRFIALFSSELCSIVSVPMRRLPSAMAVKIICIIDSLSFSDFLQD